MYLIPKYLQYNGSYFETLTSSFEGYFKLPPETLIMPISSHQFQLTQVYMFLKNQRDDFKKLVHVHFYYAPLISGTHVRKFS